MEFENIFLYRIIRRFFSVNLLLLLLINWTTIFGALPDNTDPKKFAEDFLISSFPQTKNANSVFLNEKYVSSDTCRSIVYAYENEGGGFVFVLKTNDELTIAGYSETSFLDFEIANPALKSLVSLYESVISVNSESPVEKKGTVAPMLEIEGIHWNQTGYYNYSCPYDADYGTYSYAGCVAVAMAQVMRYHNYPETGVGSHSYIHPKFGELSADFANTTYNWSNMPGSISSENTDVADLLFHCGVAVDMDYSATLPGSGAFSSSSAYALSNYFKYYSAKFISKDNFYYFNDEMETTLRNELDKGRPFLYELPGNPGHLVVSDGYDGEYFHINFGWGGAEDGYFVLDGVRYISIYEFGFRGNSIIGISPNPVYCNKQDSLALVSLYNATGGSLWTHNDNWLTGNVTNWYGVDVIDGRVVHLFLGYNNLVGTIPTDIANLDALKRLTLSGNQLSGSLDYVKNMNDLVELQLGYNQFSGTIPPEIGSNIHLSTLNLTHNNFSGEIPKEIGNLSELRFLQLPHNSLTGTVPEEICNLTKIQNLNLGNNSFTGPLPEYIGNLSGLSDFNVSYNQFSGNLPESIASMTGLVAFEITDNQFEGAVPSGISSLTNLMFLFLQNNRFTSLPEEIGLLTDLQGLNVSNNLLADSLPSSIGNLVNLKYLDLEHNELTSIPSSIGNLTKLIRLTLNNNKIKELPGSIGYLKELNELHLEYNELESLPYEIGLCDNLPWINAKYNNISSLTFGVSLMKKLNGINLSYNNLSSPLPLLGHFDFNEFFIDHNNLTFSQIAASDLAPKPFPTHSYGSQASVKLDIAEIEFTVNDSVGIDIRDISALSHPQNSYIWYKNGSEVETGPVLAFAKPNSETEGDYYCEIHNSIYTTLTLQSDSLHFKLATALENKLDTIISNNVLSRSFLDDSVTLLIPDLIRGEVTWQASVDSVTWYDISSTGTDPYVSVNIKSIANNKLVIEAEEELAYRYKVTEENCLPVYSDTILVSPYRSELLLDTLINVDNSSSEIKLEDIEITIPRNLTSGDFRLTIEKVVTPPSAPDSVLAGSVFDVNLSCGTQFELPIIIKLKVDSDSLLPEKFDRFSAVYFDETSTQWIAYEESLISAWDSTIVFETYHLTKLSWWWDQEALLSGYTDKFVKDKVTVYYSSKDWVLHDAYDQHQSSQPWHLSPGDAQYETPVIVQDIAYFCNETITKFAARLIKVPESITIYAGNFDDFGNVGIMGMIRGYLNISINNDSPDILRSTVAHEYMHFTQDYYMTALPGNTFWMEANGHTADRMVWNTDQMPVSESDKYLLESRNKKASIFNSLARSWDYWDTNILTSNLLGNVDYCYLAGCFIHYMRSYKEGTKLKPETLLKDTPTWSAWKEYLHTYIQTNLSSTIGNQFEDYVKYIFKGENKNFTVLNTGEDATDSPLKFINQTDDIFSTKHIYKLPEFESEIPVINESIVKGIPNLSAKMEQFYNLSPNRSLYVKYKRLHADTANIHVYLCQYDNSAQQMKMQDISRIDSSFFVIKAANEDNIADRSTQAYFLFINKNKDDALAAHYDIEVMPVADFDYLNHFYFIIPSTYTSNLPIHNFTDGKKRSIYLSYYNLAENRSKIYSDSSFTTSFSDGDSSMELYYNFLKGDLTISETYFMDYVPVFDPDGCVYRSFAHTLVFKFKDIFVEPMSKDMVESGAGIYSFQTENTTDTRDHIVSISYDGTEICNTSGGQGINEYSYTGSDWGYSPDIRLNFQFK